MNIIIISYKFYPEPSPRAFRTYELVKEFCRQGHEVKLILPNKSIYQDNLYKHELLKTVYIGNKIQSKKGKKEVYRTNYNRSATLKQKILPAFFRDRFRGKYSKFINWKRDYFPPLFHKEFAKVLGKYLETEKKADIVLSIGLPIEVHLGTAKGILFNRELRKNAVTIADYGDPYFYYEGRKIFFLYFLLDYFVAKIFNYISIPTEKAIQSYLSFKKRKKILIIPQAVNLKGFEIQRYSKNSIPTFGYAGVLYKEVREPRDFLAYLMKLKIDFKFVFYTIKKYDTLSILNDFKELLEEKIILKLNFDRKDIIREISQMDFLINFENTTSNQVPSKLIDYAIAKRPVCPISTSDFKPRVFNEFLEGDYTNDSGIELDDSYDVKNIVNRIIDLKKA